MWPLGQESEASGYSYREQKKKKLNNNKILLRDILLHIEMSPVVHTVCLATSVHILAACPKAYRSAWSTEDTQNNMCGINEHQI